MTPISILHEAEIEVWEAVQFYENRSAGLGLDFEKEIKTATELIQQSPWSVAGPEGRHAQVLDPLSPVLRRLCRAQRLCVDHCLCPLQEETRILVWVCQEGGTSTRTTARIVRRLLSDGRRAAVSLTDAKAKPCVPGPGTFAASGFPPVHLRSG